VSKEYEDALERLASLLERIPAMHDRGSRSQLVRMLTRHGYTLPEVGEMSTVLSYCYQLIEAAANQPNALQQLSDCMPFVDSSGLANNFAAEIRRLAQSEIFTLSDRFDFIQEIARYISVNELDSYYQEATRGMVPPRHLACAADLVDALEGLLVPHEPCHPLVLLTEAIGLRATLGNVREAAHEWSEKLTRFIGERVPGHTPDAEHMRLTAFRQRATSEHLPRTRRAIFVHVVEPWGPSQDRYLYRLLMYLGKTEPEFLFASDAACDLEGIREKVISELQNAMARLSRFDDKLEIQLEFFLPRSLLCYPVEDWSSQESGRISLGMLYVVVVRDLDRLGDPVLWQACKNKWHRGRRTAEASASDGLFYRWITCGDPPVSLSGVLPDKCVALGLTFPPPPQGQRTDLVDALDAGTPIALWPRNRCDHPDGLSQIGQGTCLGQQFKADVCARIAGRRLADLPALVLEMRQEQDLSDGAGLVLLWDNPTHFPDVREHRLAPPLRLEEL
jgi:hypothetical protein